MLYHSYWVLFIYECIINNNFYLYSFHFRKRPCCLLSFSFTLKVLFTHFIYCLPCYSWLPFTEFLILLIWSWMYLNCSFCMLTFIGFLLLCKNAFLRVSFFPHYCWLLWNSKFASWFDWYALYCCFHVGSDNIFIFVFHSISFWCLLKSIEFVSYSYHIFINNVPVVKQQPVIICDFECLLLISA